MGVDTVISTVTGTPQLRLIEAAVYCRVRRFAPAEFEGRPGLRSENDPLDRGRALAKAHLQYYANSIQSTVFVCGILYERFAINGMVSHRIGVNTGYSNEGDYIVDVRNMIAEAAPVYSDAAGNLATICLTSAYDVGRFVVRALALAQWPTEMTMCGERMTVNTLLEAIKTYRGMFPSLLTLTSIDNLVGRPYQNIQYQNPEGLRYQYTMAQMVGDVPKQRRLLTLLATAEGHYDFAAPGYLNTQFPDIHNSRIRFQNWFLQNWASVP